jgi:hypothetical protein
MRLIEKFFYFFVHSISDKLNDFLRFVIQRNSVIAGEISRELYSVDIMNGSED